MSAIADNLRRVQDRIAASCARAGRSDREVRLVVVTKTRTPGEIEAAARAGAKVFGENYVQEAGAKIEALGIEEVSWHFIGHLQSKKSRDAVKLFDMVETVDSVKLARELGKRAGAVGRTMDVLIQVHLSDETTKSGVTIEGIEELVAEVVGLDDLNLKGLMTMPPWFDDPEDARPYFVKLRQIRDGLTGKFPGVDLSELSMGMSGDFEVAIEEGATLVRVGTAIFGPRS